MGEKTIFTVRFAGVTKHAEKDREAD